MLGVKKIRKGIIAALILLIMAISGFFVFFGQQLFAQATETSTEEYYDFTEWNSHEDSWIDDGINYQEYSEYLKKYSTNKESIVVLVSTGVCTFHPMLKNRIATVKEDDTLTYTESNGKTKYKYSLTKGDVLGFAIGKQSEYTFSYKDYVGINPNIPLEYKEYRFEDDQGLGTQEAVMLASLTPNNVKILPMKKDYSNYYEMQDTFLLFKQLIAKQYNIVGVYYNIGDMTDKTDKDYDCEIEGKQTFKEMMTRHVDELKEKYGVFTVFPSGNSLIDMDTQVKGIDSVILAGHAERPVVHNAGTEDEYETYVVRDSGYGKYRDFTAPGVQMKIVDFELIEIDGEEYIDPSKISFDLSRKGTGSPAGGITLLSMIANYYLDKNYYDENGRLLYSRGELADKIEQRIIDGCINPTNSKEEAVWDPSYGWGIVSYTGYQLEINHTATKKIEFVYDGKTHLPVYTSNIECDVFYSLTEDGEYNLTNEEVENLFKNVTSGAINVYYRLVAKDDILDSEGNTTFFAKTIGVVQLHIKPMQLTIKLADYVVEKGSEFAVEHCVWILESGQIASGETLQLIFSSNVDLATIGKYNITAVCEDPNYQVNIIAAEVKIVEPIDDLERKVLAIFIPFATLVFLLVMVVSIKLINLRRKRNY